MAQAQRVEAAGEEEQSATRRPVNTAKHGNVEIAVWRNNGSKGDLLRVIPDDSL